MANQIPDDILHDAELNQAINCTSSMQQCGYRKLTDSFAWELQLRDTQDHLSCTKRWGQDRGVANARRSDDVWVRYRRCNRAVSDVDKWPVGR